MANNKKNWSLKKKVVGKESIWPWKFSISAPAFKWKSIDNLHVKIVDNLVFRVLYVVEAIVLLSTLCFFYLCCGCHI